VFTTLGLTSVYSAWWFLLMLGVLIVSTSLCIARNTPKILHDLRTHKEHLREQALQAFHLKGAAGEQRDTRGRIRARVLAADTRRLERQGPGARTRHDDRGTPRRGQQAGLHRGALGDRAGAARRPARRRPDRARADGAAGQEHVYRRRLHPRRAGAAPPAARNPTFRGNLLVPEGAAPASR
jgi:cytochrome c biogenesis protein